MRRATRQSLPRAIERGGGLRVHAQIRMQTRERSDRGVGLARHSSMADSGPTSPSNRTFFLSKCCPKAWYRRFRKNSRK